MSTNNHALRGYGKPKHRAKPTTGARQDLDSRVRQLVLAPDTPSQSYLAAARRYEALACRFGWTNTDGSLYPVSLGSLQRYVAYHENRVKPQSLLSYLSALKEKHEQLGFLEWSSVRFHGSILRMLRNIKRNHTHTKARRSKPITKEHLRAMKSRLDLSNPRHALFWAVASVAFHAMARLGELLPPDQARAERAVRLDHLVIDAGDKGPYATITLPTSKTHNPDIEAVLSIWADGSDTCPFKALQSFLQFRLGEHYAKGSQALWCIENGRAISKQWFLEALSHFLPEEDVTGHSFRAGGATHLALQGHPKWIIQRLGRWTSDAFEVYIRARPELLIAFAQASEQKIRSNPSGSCWKERTDCGGERLNLNGVTWEA